MGRRGPDWVLSINVMYVLHGITSSLGREVQTGFFLLMLCMYYMALHHRWVERSRLVLSINVIYVLHGITSSLGRRGPDFLLMLWYYISYREVMVLIMLYVLHGITSSLGRRGPDWVLSINEDVQIINVMYVHT